MAHNLPELNVVSPIRNRPTTAPKIDWNLCVLCQIDDGTTLVNPAKRKKNTEEDGYTTLHTNLNTLGELNALPFNIDLLLINDGLGIESTLRSHSAKWHSSCYKRCSNREVTRAEQRTKKLEISQSTPVKKKL